MTAAAALELAEQRLAAAGVETPMVDAEWLVAHVLGIERGALHVAREHEVPAEFNELLERRARREPLAYVLGEWGFRRLTLKTDARALVPRPETEVVVQRALDLIAELEEPRVLDLGVGGGAIALSIADEHPRARVTGVDTSGDALELARENATRLGLQIDLREGGVEVAAEGWDLVVSNPPYIPPDDLAAAPAELEWEPPAALVDTHLHEEIARTADTRWLVFEVGYGKAEDVAATLRGLGYSDVAITQDLAGLERVVEGRR